MEVTQAILNELQSISNPTYSEVKALRKALNINTEQAGVLIGVSKRTWERYESGSLIMSNSRWLYLSIIAGNNPTIKILNFGN
jgi:DNA-binding transcriptional regulator YiaG